MNEIIAVLILESLICITGFLILSRRNTKSAAKQVQDIINESRINEDLNSKERTMLKEYRLRKAGHRYCGGCGKVGGLFYRQHDGTTKGITLLKITGTKDKYICSDCNEKST